MQRLRTSFNKSSHWLIAILLLGLVNGMIYVFLVPPWQHYDEPSHFEYVWLVANRPSLPKPGDFDKNMRLQVATSMVEHNFYGNLAGTTPRIEDVATNIGYSQLDDPPLYYIVAALPVRLLRGESVTLQMYAARMVSLGLYLVTILIGWGLVGELVTDKHPLRWMVPTTLALLPGFTDLMTAVNNGAGAILVFSFFLWASVRLIQRGATLFGTVLVLAAAVLCFWTANTTWIAIPLTPVVLLFTLLRGRWRLFAWTLFLVTILIGLGAIFKWGDAATWYRRTVQTSPTRVKNSLAPLGEHAFRLDLSPENGSQSSIQQPLPIETVRALDNSKVEIGAWIWSSQPMVALLPSLTCFCGGKNQVLMREIESGTEPQFFWFSTNIPANVINMWVTLATPTDEKINQGAIFYDGLILIKGEKEPQSPPQFADANGNYGTWGEQPFTNLVRNPSAEQAGPGFQSWANKIGEKLIPAYPTSYPSDGMVSLLDWKGASWYYQLTSSVLLRTFWARFGWGNVPLIGSKPYRSLGVITILGIAGAVWTICRRWRVLNREVLLLLGLAGIGIWVLAFLRGIGSLVGNPYIPVARYASTAILPTVLVLNVGWWEIMRNLGRWLRMTTQLHTVIYLLFFISLDVLALLSIIHFYY
jgi:hypothetical protein